MLEAKVEMEPHVVETGRKFVYTIKNLNIEVEIRDVKVVYGTKRFLVSVAGQPGSNAIWIYAPERMKFTN